MNADFWEERYQSKATGWDIGYVSTPIKEFIDQLTDKNLDILVPGAGNGYEVAYLYEKGFRRSKVVEIASTPLSNLKKTCPEIPDENLFQQDFFEHEGQYDLIIEQTFFCALNPELRSSYVEKMADLLKTGGTLAGLLFDFPLDETGPPFGGSIEEYKNLFSKHFKIKILEHSYNSIKPRMGKELFFIFEKK